MSTNVGQPETNVGSLAHKETFVERFAHKLGTTVHTSTIFGAPIERDGVTVIPVGKARWAFGAGGGPGSDTERDEGGSGGGAWVTVSPVGYIVLKDGKPRYRPIFDFGMILQLLIGSGIVAGIVLAGVRKLVHPYAHK